jgi:TetR/AcrR family transcriptional regulator
MIETYLAAPKKTFENLSYEKQERITRAAMEEFGQKGYGGASINVIVQSLGIAKGSIFQYFGDKKGLFLFVFSHCMEQVKDYLRKTRDATKDQDLFTRLETTLIAGVNFIRKHPFIYRFYMKILYEPSIPFRDEILLSIRRYSFDYLKSLLETAKTRTEISSDLNISQAAFLLDAVMDRFLQTQTIEHLDAGLGLFQCEQKEAEKWAAGLIGILRTGLYTK